MKVIEMKSILKTEKFDNYNCNFKITKDGHRTTLDDVINAINNLDKKLSARIDHLESRIDNLVEKNNLKE